MEEQDEQVGPPATAQGSDAAEGDTIDPASKPPLAVRVALAKKRLNALGLIGGRRKRRAPSTAATAETPISKTAEPPKLTKASEEASLEVTLLNKTQIWGDAQIDGPENGQLHIMRHYGTACGMSDLAILLGGTMGDSDFETSDGHLAGNVWSASSDSDANDGVCIVYINGEPDNDYLHSRSCGIRPALPPAATSVIRPDDVKPTRKIIGMDDATQLQIVEYGKYPQTVASEKIASRLEGLYIMQQSGVLAPALRKTGKNYSLDDKKDPEFPFPEYLYDGKQYIRVIANPRDEDSVLSTGDRAIKGKAYWVAVQPIEWLVEPEGGPDAGLWLAKQALVSGIPFHDPRDSKSRYSGDFKSTTLYGFMNKPFLRDIQPQRWTEQVTGRPSTGTIARP